MRSTVRLATAAHAPALVRLRASMFAAMGQEVGDEHAAWRALATTWFAAHLGSDAVAAVADEDGGTVASAMAVLLPRAPGPSDPSSVAAHVSQVSTLAANRRRGHARACLVLLLAELERRGVARADLHATPDGAALYRGLGFRDSPYPSLRRTAG